MQTNQLLTAPMESAIILLNLKRFDKRKHQVEVMMTSGSVYDDDDENDDNLGLNREEEEETSAEGESRSQQNTCLKSAHEFIMQTGEFVPLNSPQQEDEQTLKKCGQGARGDHWISLQDRVIKYRAVFDLNDSDLGSTDVVNQRIETGSSKPIKVPPHRISPARIPIIPEEVRKMLKRGVIQPSRNTYSTYNAPIILQKKKDRSWRLFVHYTKLNDATVKEAYPMPNRAQVFKALSGSTFFSSAELANGYWQVPVAAEHRHKNAFVNHSNRPATFQQRMNALF